MKQLIGKFHVEEECVDDYDEEFHYPMMVMSSPHIVTSHSESYDKISSVATISESISHGPNDVHYLSSVLSQKIQTFFFGFLDIIEVWLEISWLEELLTEIA